MPMRKTGCPFFFTTAQPSFSFRYSKPFFAASTAAAGVPVLLGRLWWQE